MNEEMPCSIYEDNGYASREHYLECLSEDYNVPLDTVDALANLYGEVEMFDGLVTALQDIEGCLEFAFDEDFSECFIASKHYKEENA